MKIDTFDDLERHFSNKCYFSDLKKLNIEFILLFDNKNLKEDCKNIVSNFVQTYQILLNKDLNKHKSTRYISRRSICNFL